MTKQRLSIAQVKELLAADTIDETTRTMLMADSRLSVARLLAKWEEQQVKKEQERLRLHAMYTYERQFTAQQLTPIVGVDEAGRGPLAGPVVVAGVILPFECSLPGINDSKKLTERQREKLYEQIMTHAVAVERIIVPPAIIDRDNIYQATVQAMYQVIAQLTPAPAAALIDAVPLPALTIPVESLIGGDGRSASIAAASIVAKVERDRLMLALDQEYPQYGFVKHKGYGTAAHMATIRQFGPCPAHRQTFEPIASYHQTRIDAGEL